MYNVYGVICGTYEEACIVAGVETQAQAAWEAAQDRMDWNIDCQDAMEARGGPLPSIPEDDDG